MTMSKIDGVWGYLNGSPFYKKIKNKKQMKKLVYIVIGFIIVGMVSTSCSRINSCKGHPGITQDFENTQPKGEHS